MKMRKKGDAGKNKEQKLNKKVKKKTENEEK